MATYTRSRASAHRRGNGLVSWVITSKDAAIIQGYVGEPLPEGCIQFPETIPIIVAQGILLNNGACERRRRGHATPSSAQQRPDGNVEMSVRGPVVWFRHG